MPLLAGSHCCKDHPSDVCSHGGVGCHVWLYTKNHISVMHDDVSFEVSDSKLCIEMKAANYPKADLPSFISFVELMEERNVVFGCYHV